MCRWRAEDDFLDYYVFTGGIKEVLAQYTDLTGKGVVPPKWTFGYWQSKIQLFLSRKRALEIARKLREHQFPCDVIHLDTHWFTEDWFCNLEFAPDRFPDPAAILGNSRNSASKSPSGSCPISRKARSFLTT